MKVTKLLLLIAFLTSIIGGVVSAQSTTEVKLKDYKRIDNPARDEVSGIVKEKDLRTLYGFMEILELKTDCTP